MHDEYLMKRASTHFIKRMVNKQSNILSTESSLEIYQVQ